MKNLKIIYYAVLIWLFLSCKNNPQSKTDELVGLSFSNKPNILWISVEDIGCNLACYGDSTVETPNIDRLAAEGVVFENAYAVAGVCAPSRSSIITAMYPSYMGTVNMRTNGIDIPDTVKPFTEYLREDGYYCTNNPKEDYNFKTPEEAWDESGFAAHYYHREDKDQPFFAVYNILACHESQIWCNNWEHLTVEPDSARVPLYFPQDNDVVKKDVARKYANIELMDLYVGQKLKMFEQQGLLDNTIVVFWSDHGGPLPRQKWEVTHSGLKVPLIIRFPGKQLAGTRISELVSLMDLGPSMLSLTGTPPPSYMQGRAFAGQYKEPAPDYSYGMANRMDESVDLSRSVTDGRYRYVRNYYPEFTGFRFNQYRFNMKMMNEMYKMHNQGELKGFCKKWFTRKKSVEELYDTKTDRDEVVNLAGNPGYKEKLEEMRNALLNWQQPIPDACLLTEGELYIVQHENNMPVAEFLNQNPGYYKSVQTIANQSLYPEKYVNQLLKALNDTIPSVRYWAVRGIGRLREKGKPYIPEILNLRDDPSLSVQVAVAWTLNELGESEKALTMYQKILTMESADNPVPENVYFCQIHAVGDLMYNKTLAAHLESTIEDIAKSKPHYLKRGAENLLLILAL